MRLLNRKSRLQRVFETATDALDSSSGVKLGIPGMDSGRALKVGVPGGKAARAGMIAAGGLAGLTVGSAGISSLRRHRGGARDDS